MLITILWILGYIVGSYALTFALLAWYERQEWSGGDYGKMMLVLISMVPVIGLPFLLWAMWYEYSGWKWPKPYKAPPPRILTPEELEAKKHRENWQASGAHKHFEEHKKNDD